MNNIQQFLPDFLPFFSTVTLIFLTGAWLKEKPFMDTEARILNPIFCAIALIGMLMYPSNNASNSTARLWYLLPLVIALVSMHMIRHSETKKDSSAKPKSTGRAKPDADIPDATRAAIEKGVEEEKSKIGFTTKQKQPA